MSLRDTLRESDEYQQITQEAASAADEARNETADTVADAMQPLTTLEKGDAEFWLDVLTVVLLFMLYREVSGGTAGGVA